MKNYIPKNEVDLELLRDDISQRQSEFTQESLAKMLGLSPVGLYYKLIGKRAIKFGELDSLARKLSENFRKYLKDGHVDAAS